MTETCTWAEDWEGNWETSCGEAFIFYDGAPSENGMKFCCYCGKELAEVRYVEPGVEEDESNT